MKFFLTTTLLMFCSCIAFGQEPRSFQSNGLYGFKEGGSVTIEPEYTYAFDFTDGLALVKKDGKWGFIDAFNVPIIPLEYDRCSEFEDGFAIVIKNGKSGIINDAGKIIVPAECNHVQVLEDGFCVGQSDGKYALFKDGSKLSDFAYDKIVSIYYGYFACQKGELYGVMTPDGKELIAPQFTSQPSCYGGREEGSGYYFTGSPEGSRSMSYFSENGDLVLNALEYDIKQVYYPNIYAGTKDGKITVANVITGEVMLPPTTATILDENWRPCDGYGYSNTSQLFYDKDSIILMQSVAQPQNTARLEVMPVVFEEFILALQPDGLYSVYSHNVELLAKDVHVKFERIEGHSSDLRICTIAERQLWMWKDGKFGYWNNAKNTLEFVTKVVQDAQLLFDAPELISDQVTTFEALHYEGDNFLFTAISGGLKFIFLYKDSEYLWEMDAVDPSQKVQFKKLQYDEYEEGGQTYRELYNVKMKVDGKKMDYGW